MWIMQRLTSGFMTKKERKLSRKDKFPYKYLELPQRRSMRKSESTMWKKQILEMTGQRWNLLQKGNLRNTMQKK